METRKVSSITPEHYIGQDVEVAEAKFLMLKGPVIQLKSGVIALKENDKLPEGKELTASKLIGLKEDPSDKKVVLPEGGKGLEFFKGKGIDTSKIPDFVEGATIDVLIGMKCVVQKNEKTNYLDLV